MTTFIHHRIRMAVIIGVSMLSTGCSMTSYLPDMPTLNWFSFSDESAGAVEQATADETADGTADGGTIDDTIDGTTANQASSTLVSKGDSANPAVQSVAAMPSTRPATRQATTQSNGDLASRITALEQALSEVLGLKPSIEKVAAMEKDMAFLVAQLNQSVDVTQFETEQRAQALNELPAELSVINDTRNDPAKLTLTPVTPDTAFIEAELQPLEDDAFIDAELQPLEDATFIDTELQPLEDDKFTSEPNAALQFPDTSLRALNPNASQVTKLPAQRRAASLNNQQESLRIEAAKPLQEFQSAVANNTDTAAVNKPSVKATKPAQRGEYSLHLVSLSETPNVKGAIKDLSNKLQGHMESMAFYTKPVSVNGKTIYRVQLNAYASRAQALEACQRVRQVAGYCSVTTSEGANAV